MQLIDKVQDYTNLFILQSEPISKNQSTTTQICDYAINKGLYIICDDPSFSFDEKYQKLYYWKNTS
jgi:hypothetical protein